MMLLGVILLLEDTTRQIGNIDRGFRVPRGELLRTPARNTGRRRRRT